MGDISTLLIILAGALVLLLYTRSVAKKALEKKKTGGFTSTQTNKSIETKDRLDRLLVDIQEISRECIGKMDIRIKMLNQLIIDADARKKELENLIKKTEGIKNKLPQATQPINPIHQKVFRCADRGLSIQEICKETDLEKGEVELILNLREIKDIK